MHGASLIYNLILAEQVGKAEWVADYSERLQEWALLVESRIATFTNWDHAQFWNHVDLGNPRVSRSRWL